MTKRKSTVGLLTDANERLQIARASLQAIDARKGNAELRGHIRAARVAVAEACGTAEKALVLLRTQR